MTSHAIPICHMYQKPVLTGFYLFKLATATKVDMTVKCQMCVMEIIVMNVVY